MPAVGARRERGQDDDRHRGNGCVPGGGRAEGCDRRERGCEGTQEGRRHMLCSVGREEAGAAPSGDKIGGCHWSEAQNQVLPVAGGPGGHISPLRSALWWPESCEWLSASVSEGPQTPRPPHSDAAPASRQTGPADFFIFLVLIALWC